MSIYTLRKGDIFIQGDVYRLITGGELTYDTETEELDQEGATMRLIGWEEAEDYADEGSKVLDLDDRFHGLWERRPLAVSN